MPNAAHTDEITPERRELWAKIGQLWLGGVELRRMSVRVNLMEHELRDEMDAMRRNGYDLDPLARNNKPSTKAATTAEIERATSTWGRQLTYWHKVGYRDGFAYVIRAGKEGPVKIGKAMDPEARLCELQTAQYVKLRLLHILPGYSESETALHARVHADRIRGEWFSGPLVDELLEWLDGFTASMVTHHRATHEILTVPDTTERKSKPRGIPSGAFDGHGLQSRWRIKPDREAPVTVRFVDPKTLT